MDTQNIFEAHISPLTLLIVVSSLNLLTHVTILQEAIYLIDSLVLLWKYWTKISLKMLFLPKSWKSSTIFPASGSLEGDYPPKHEWATYS